MSNPLCPKTERERDEARAERDRLAKALEEIIELEERLPPAEFPDCEGGYASAAEDCAQIARKALKA